MKQRYLEVTYRKGKPLAAYLYLARNPGDLSARTERHDRGLVVDFTADGRAIGIEITAPTKLSLATFNQALTAINQAPVTADDLAPLLAAASGPAAVVSD